MPRPAEEAQRAYDRASSAREAVVSKFNERLIEVLRPTPIRTDDMLRDLTKDHRLLGCEDLAGG